jgi:hypothetical protein
MVVLSEVDLGHILASDEAVRDCKVHMYILVGVVEGQCPWSFGEDLETFP